jgi:hypothetical protein
MNSMNNTYIHGATAAAKGFRRVHLLQFLLLLCFLPSKVLAFSLLGPFASWMDAAKNYGDAIGGPMAIGEGYRWNMPTVTYGFDQTFLDYYGLQGVADVEKAIRVFNELPPASQINSNLLNFSLNARGINLNAQDSGIIDLKLAAMKALLEEMGLGTPMRYIYCLRDIEHAGGVINYVVIQRNYDPVTCLPSGSVNECRFYYRIYDNIRTASGVIAADAVEYAIDPLSDPYTAVADSLIRPGLFNRSEITRDDAGGLGYLYSSNNIQIESLITGVRGATENPASFVNTAPRPGVEKVNFLKMDRNPITRQFITITNRFKDAYVGTSNKLVTQMLERVISRPDIVFGARELNDGGFYYSTGTTNWANFASLNSTGTTDGPGIIQPPIEISFNRSFGSGPYVIWGSFDGTTNPPVSYPNTTATAARLTVLHQEVSKNMERGFSIMLSNSICLSYRLQASTDLLHWIDVTNFIGDPGSTNMVDPAAGNFNRRFYRVETPY